MFKRRLFVLSLLFAAGVQAQWLNFPTPGTPRTADGKPKLTAPAPRGLDGKPDLSGVWMHEKTTIAEMRRLFGDRFESDIALAPPGMEIGTQHKYVFDILLDYKPEAAMLRPKAVEMLRSFAASRNPANVCTGVFGFPMAGLLSEPIKIVQAPRLTMVLYEVQNLRRQIYTDGRALPKEVDFRLIWAIRPDIGTATLSWWRAPGSTTRPHWMPWGTRTAKRCTSRNDSIGATSATWISR